MRFSDWLAKQPRGTKKRLERETGVGYTTIHGLASGALVLNKYDVAKKISDATGGAVSIDELCTPAAPEPGSEEKRTGTDDR